MSQASHGGSTGRSSFLHPLHFFVTQATQRWQRERKNDRQQVLKEISESTSVQIDVTPAYFPQTPIRDLGFGVKTEKILPECFATCTSHPHLVLTMRGRYWTNVTRRFSSFSPIDLKTGLTGDSEGSTWLPLKVCYSKELRKVEELRKILITVSYYFCNIEKLNSKSKKILEMKFLMWIVSAGPYDQTFCTVSLPHFMHNTDIT